MTGNSIILIPAICMSIYAPAASFMRNLSKRETTSIKLQASFINKAIVLVGNEHELNSLGNSKVQTHHRKTQQGRFSRAETSISTKCLLIRPCQAFSAETKITTSIGTNSGCFVRLQLFSKLLTRKTGRRSFHHKSETELNDKVAEMNDWVCGREIGDAWSGFAYQQHVYLAKLSKRELVLLGGIFFGGSRRRFI